MMAWVARIPDHTNSQAQRDPAGTFLGESDLSLSIHGTNGIFTYTKTHPFTIKKAYAFIMMSVNIRYVPLRPNGMGEKRPAFSHPRWCLQCHGQWDGFRNGMRWSRQLSRPEGLGMDGKVGPKQLNGVMGSLISRVITPVTHLFSAI